ncbi:MAG: hypothetical protein JWN15_2217 [Firmicutes bacterium]|nr:hypothetical protein [Bacillota bacterium]
MSRSSERKTSMLQTEAHPWLKEKVYEPARQRTVQLVQRAVDSLVQNGRRVSLTTVIAESTHIDPDGCGVSKGGILGNSDAKAYYDRHKSWRGPSRRKSADSGEQGITHTQRPINPNRDTARVRNRLTQKTKDELADRVLELEQGFALQEQRWLRLNDELLQWRLRAEKAEGQVERMRRALEAKDAQVRELHKRLDDILTPGSGMTDAAAYHALQEAIQRAQTAEEQAKDLRRRLFAKRVVRMRDKARRLEKTGSAKFSRPTNRGGAASVD